MEDISFTSLLAIALPALITGGIAYYFFGVFFKNEEKRRIYKLKKENKQQTLPLQLQAYERITLFLERITPSNLLLRVKPLGENKEAYLNLLQGTIEQEYEHNLSQQIYISEECWNIIVSSKNTTSHIVKEVAEDETIKDAQSLREGILKKILNTTPPSAVAISFVKEEVSKML